MAKRQSCVANNHSTAGGNTEQHLRPASGAGVTSKAINVRRRHVWCRSTDDRIPLFLFHVEYGPLKLVGHTNALVANYSSGAAACPSQPFSSSLAEIPNAAGANVSQLS